MFKPFRPPLLKKAGNHPPLDLPKAEHVSDSADSELDEDVRSRPAKRRRLKQYVEDEPNKAPIASAVALSPRIPLVAFENACEPRPVADDACKNLEGYYMVLWRKFTTKKHKTWDGDGILSVKDGCARLQDISGKEMGRTTFSDALLVGSTLSIGGKDVEVDSTISKSEFLAGRPFLNTSAKRLSSSEKSSGSASHRTPIRLPQGKVPLPSSTTGPGNFEIPAKSFYAAPRGSSAMQAKFKNPLLSSTVMPKKLNGGPTPRHDPNAPGALVMTRPLDIPRGKEVVDVVLDPFLCQHLREHQRQGLKFMYECVMGMRDFNGQGTILADEMGLGKTLQSIALLWTLLKQNPIYGSEGVIKKALIVCPVTLITNWKKEFQKWLGNERIGVLVADGQNIKLTDFTHGRSYSVMIIGYEKLRSVQDELKKGSGIDIVVADEGHRLKTAQNKSAQAIKSLNTPRRIILSGTPIQNDLSEFFTMVDFVNPGLLGTYNTFKREFEGPILKSRQPEAKINDIEKGKARAEELSSLTKMFILRRTAELLSRYLKPKTEYVLFCTPTEAQIRVYNEVLASPYFGKILGSSDASLLLIGLLKKVCNSPSLLNYKDEPIPSTSIVAELLKAIPQDVLRMPIVAASTKLRLLDTLLKNLSTTTREKIVVVSNYTATLDIIGKHLVAMGLPFLRLDGSTPSNRRQDLVDTFNKTPASVNFAFLLSAKSGGTGINLIGASRLVLFDVDWNPAVDLQAMARIHRDGQKRPVKIYRFLMAGGMDEKIYQRQITKMGLADSVVDGKKSETSFTAAELRDLFRLNLDTGCQTHDLIGCACQGRRYELPPQEALAEPEQEESDNGSEEFVEFSEKPVYAIVTATKANVEAIEKQITEEAEGKRVEKSRSKMQALMRYKHIDTSPFQGEALDVFGLEPETVRNIKDALDDEVLVNSLTNKRCKVGFVFAKSG